MGRIAKLLSFTRVTRNDAKVNDVKVDTGGGANLTAEHFASAGDDSFPLVGDYVTVIEVPRSGNGNIVGYLDPNNTPKALEGEKRIYARDPANGNVVSEFWLKNTGSVVLSNSNGSVTLEANGDVKIDGGATGKVAIGNDTEELVSLMEEFLTALTVMTTATAIGPQPPINLATFTDLLTRIATIKGTL